MQATQELLRHESTDHKVDIPLSKAGADLVVSAVWGRWRAHEDKHTHIPCRTVRLPQLCWRRGAQTTRRPNLEQRNDNFMILSAAASRRGGIYMHAAVVHAYVCAHTTTLCS